MKAGKALERLVEVLERHLGSQDNVKVESPKYLEDSTTGKKREHDVVLTIKASHHSAIISIECKDRKRPVGVPEVEAFWAKCEHTNVNKAVFVSTSGFAKSAKEKAAFLGVSCLSLEEVNKLDWLAGDASVIEHSKIHDKAVLSYLYDEVPLHPLDEYGFFSPDDEIISDELVKHNLKLDADKMPFGEEGKWQKFQHRYRTDGCYLKHRDNGDVILVPEVIVDVTYKYEVTSTRFEQMKYFDSVTGSEIADVAVANINFDGGDKRITLIDDGERRVMSVLGSEGS